MPEIKKSCCEKCNGKGWYQYSNTGTPHSTICDECCPHDQGFWELIKMYGDKNGKLCCLRGCGFIKENYGTGIKPPANEVKGGECKHCGGLIAIRNLKGNCDHLYYPDNCETCKNPTPISGGEDIDGEKKEILEALAIMYEQYCQTGHHFMSAGERASVVLEKHGLISPDEAGRGEIKWEKLK